ncbi:MAG: hypothetical protein M0C28_23345 [Candidatus Moduliflexus flocculans]|nr:hypothetical protein [Candidatus Moduliflexus flocculans]
MSDEVFAFHPHLRRPPIRRGDPHSEGPGPPGRGVFPQYGNRGQPRPGRGAPDRERAAVLGLGIVGLLTVALLSRFPLAALLGLDGRESRRKTAQELGATSCPEEPDREGGMDLVYELTGNPEALDAALGLCGYARLCVGSWYAARKPIPWPWARTSTGIGFACSRARSARSRRNSPVVGPGNDARR